MDSLAEFWKGRKTIKGVLVLNALLPGLGVIYAGGGIWAVALPPFWLMGVAGGLFSSAFAQVWLSGWFWSSLIGCAIVLVKRLGINSGMQAPGPNTRDLADSFGKGHGKGLTISALDTLEQKVKQADEKLKATRALEMENSKPKAKIDLYPLAEPTPIVEERPPLMAREVPHFNSSQDNLIEKDEVVGNLEESSFKLAPSAESKSVELISEVTHPEPLSSDLLLAVPDQLNTGFDFSPQAESETVPGMVPPETNLPSSFQSSKDSSQTNNDGLFDFNATSPASEMGSASPITPVPPNDLSFSLPTGTADQSPKDTIADAKFALAPAQTPDQVQKFFEKLGETVGTSYQQEQLAKPSFDISFPTFESPNFTFDFSSALANDFESMAGTNNESGEVPSKDNCQRCGVAKHADFTFCLGCGISF